MLLPISFSFDTYICMFSYRYLHRSTRVGRTVYYCDTISSPKCDDHITRVERWRYRWDNMIIPIERQENIGSFASKRAVNNNFLIYEITYLTSSYKNKNIINALYKLNSYFCNNRKITFLLWRQAKHSFWIVSITN